jgi:hypothetical protein
MIGDQQAARADEGFVGRQAYPQDLQQADRPALLEADLPGLRQEAESCRRQCQAVQDMAGEADVA